MKLRRGQHIALWSTLLAGQLGAILTLGVVWVLPTAAHTSATTSQAMSSMDMAAMAHMAAQAPKSTQVVALHKKVVHLSIFNFKFQPATLVVSRGTRLIWTNKDSDPHTVDSTKNVWSSDALDTDNTFSRVFTKTGSFTYYCSIHPFMHGTIIVK